MAYSYTQYPTDGSFLGPFQVPFPYIAKAHVEVRVAGDLKADGTHYTWVSDTSIEFLPGNAPDGVLDIRRNSKRDERLVNWQDGGGVTEALLDMADEQLMYIAQEAIDSTDATVKADFDNTWDGQSRRIKDVADPVDPQDLVTKSYGDANYGPAALQAANVASGSAASSAAAAAASEAEAEASEAVAIQKAAEASTSASQAASHASAANTSALNAAVSADDAEAARDAASASEAAAAQSEANAAASAAAALASKNAAAISQGAAATSETNSASSADAAAASASSALASASSAADSEAAASASATLALANSAAVPVGGYVEVQLDVAGAQEPPASHFVRLVAGLSGVGEYNYGKLVSETVSGTAPSMSADATVSDPESPLNGSQVRLLETEERFLRAGSPGRLQEDELRAHNHRQRMSNIGGNQGLRYLGDAGTANALSDRNYTANAGGNETRPRNIGVAIYMRIK